MHFTMPSVFLSYNLHSKNRYVKSKFPSWFSKDLNSIVLAKKRKAHAVYRSSNKPLDYPHLSNLRVQYKFESKRCYKAFLTRTKNNFINNPRSFWDFVRNNKSNNYIPENVYLDECPSSNSVPISNLFSSYFNSIFTALSVYPDNFPFLYY